MRGVLRRDVGTSLSCLYVEETEPPNSQKELENTPTVVSIAGWVWVAVLAELAGTAILPLLRFLGIFVASFIKLSYVLPCILNRNISPFVVSEGLQSPIFICCTCLLNASMLCQYSR